MIEQQNNLLLISFPTPEAAAQAMRWMEAAVVPWLPMISQSAVPATSGPLSELSPALTPDSPEPVRSRRTVLTPERQEQIANQRASGMTAHQRLLRAQTTLRDGVLPFSRPGQTPAPSGQPSPRMRAQQEGGFADGQEGVLPLRVPVPQEAERRQRSRLRPSPSQPPSRS